MKLVVEVIVFLIIDFFVQMSCISISADDFSKFDFMKIYITINLR